MNTLKTVLAVAIATASLTVPALSQDQQFKLPEQCTAMGSMDHGAHGGMKDGGTGGHDGHDGHGPSVR